MAGLAVCAVGAALPGGRRQGALLVAGATLGLAGLLGAGFAIGARGWAFEWLDALFGALPSGQFGLGLGGVLALASLLMLLGFGLARRGFFRGDLFIACAVLGCGALLLLFVALPVLRALAGAFFDEAGAPSLSALYERVGNERVWGLGCLAGTGRCGVAWNTLLLGLLTAAGTTALGTLIALLAERGGKRLGKPLQGLAATADHQPPFVVGPGADPAVRPRRRSSTSARGGVRRARRRAGSTGARRLAGELFTFTPMRLHDHARHRAGVGPSLEEAAQTLRADRRRPSCGDAAAAQARARQRLPASASSRASPISATRSSSAASTRCSRPRSSSPSSARSTTRAAQHRWR